MQEQVERIIHLAGDFLLSSNQRRHTQKTNAKDFVTVADIKAQDILTHELTKTFPGTSVLSEEHAEQARQAMFTPAFTGFVIDPIDGTYNFKRDMRESAISIGYIEKGEPVLGVIFDPYKNELYAAGKNKGATRNGRPINVSGQSELAGASVATSNSYDDEAMARNLQRQLAIYEQTGTMPWTNCPGSGVLIMAYVACGRFDIYHHNGLKPWDNAAAFLLIREAGGVVNTLQGDKAPFTSPTILAGNPLLVKQLQAVFTKINPQLLA